MPVLARIRQRLGYLALGLLLGGLAGYFAPSNGTFSATSTLRLTPTSPDSNRVAQVAQTVSALLTSAPVLDTAAQKRDTSRADLQSRVKAVWTRDTELVLVTATASSPKDAIADANAVAQAALTVAQEKLNQQLKDIRTQSELLVTTAKLPDPGAERSRLAQLGTSLASRQEAAIEGAQQVYVADPAWVAVAGGPGRPVRAALAGAGGLLLGALAALSVPAARIRPARRRDLAAAMPHLDVRGWEAAPEVAGRALEQGRPVIVVVGLTGAEDDAPAFAGKVADYVRAHGYTSRLAPDSATLTATAELLRVLAPTGGTSAAGSEQPDVLVVDVSRDDEALAMLAGQTRPFVVLLAKNRRTRLGEIDATASALRDAEPLVVMV